jgi:integrase
MEGARVKLRELHDEVERSASVEDPKLTMDGLLDRYLEAKSISKQPTTIAWYRRHFKQHVRPVIGTRRLRDLRSADIQLLLANARNTSRTKRKGEPLSPTSLRNLLVGIRAALAWAVRQNLVLTNVADKVEAPLLENREPVNIKPADVHAILSAVKGTELEAIVAFSAWTGLRRSESCALRWGDIDLEKRTICVQRAAVNLGSKVIVKSPKTKKSKRTDFLAPSVVKLLRDHRADQARRHDALGTFRLDDRAKRYVFDRQATGEPWNPNELSRLFSRMVRKKENKDKFPALRFHDLRHAYASMLFDAKVPLKVISESLGHSAIGVTSSIYVHLTSEAMLDKADALEAHLGPTVQPLPDASSDR